MTTDPTASTPVEQLRDEPEKLSGPGQPDSPAGPDDECRHAPEAELARRDHPSVPTASAGLDQAPTDPDEPTNSA